MSVRLSELDRLRGVAIVGVIIIHSGAHCIHDCYENIFDRILLILLLQISRFSVPAFLIISGFLMTQQELLSPKCTNTLVAKRVRRIIAPYVIWSAVYYILFVLTGEARPTERSMLMIFVEKLFTGTVTWQFFFIVMIIQCYVLCLLGFGREGRISNKLIAVCIVVQLGFLAGNYWASFQDSFSFSFSSRKLDYFQAFCRSFFAMYILFFLFGRWLGANYGFFLEKCEKYRSLILIGVLASLLFSAAEFLLLHEFTNGRVSVPPDWNLTTNVFGLVASVYLIGILRSFKSKKGDHVLIWLGAFSFVLFLLHEPLIGYLAKGLYCYMPQITNSQLVFQPILISLCIFLCFLLHRVITWLLPNSFCVYVFG